MQKLSIGEIGETACIICKSIVIARYKIMAQYIAITALVESLEAKKASRSGQQRDGTFTLPVHSWSVVNVAGQCAFPNVVNVYYCFMMQVAPR